MNLEWGNPASFRSQPSEAEAAQVDAPVRIQSGCSVADPSSSVMVWGHVAQAAGIPKCASWRKRRSSELPAPSWQSFFDKFCKRKLGDNLAKATMQLALGASTHHLLRWRTWTICAVNGFLCSRIRRKAKKCRRVSHFGFMHWVTGPIPQADGDPDLDIIDNNGDSSFVSGVHLGHKQQLGPAPQVYHPCVKEPSYDESQWEPCVDNYFKGSEKEADKILEQHFKEVELEGRMMPLLREGGQETLPVCRVAHRWRRDPGQA